jgi:hypothetical protein
VKIFSMAWRRFSPFVETQWMHLGHGKGFGKVRFTLLSSGLRTLVLLAIMEMSK